MADRLPASLPPLAGIYASALALREQIGVPAGTLTALARAVQTLRDIGGPAAELRRAEDISTLAHRLANAHRAPEQAAPRRVAALVHAIDATCWQGLMELPIGAMR